MTDLKCDEKSESPAMEAREYPCGLRITLDDETLDKLGLEGKFEVGADVTFTAKAMVVMKHEDAFYDGDCVGLQITAMEFSKES